MPQFNPSNRFLGEYEVPCLVAEMKNSDVPEVATKYVTDPGDELAFKVHLRVKQTEALSPWMQLKLEELFARDGLTTAITEGLKKLDADGYDFLLEDEREDVKAHGYHPYVYIQEIVLDEVKEKVLILLGDNSVLNEHGMTIHSKAGRWRFDDADPFIRYVSGFEKYLPKPKPDLQKWDEMFPKITKGRFENDCSMIFGRWVCDQLETDKLRKELGWEQIEVTRWLATISETQIEGLFRFPLEVKGMKRRGNWITVDSAFWVPGGERIPNYKGSRNKMLLWCDGRRLLDGGKSYRPPHGEVYVRVDAP